MDTTLTTGTDEAAVEALQARIDRGFKTVDDLCQRRVRWVMHVPAQPDHDPDLILADALAAGADALRLLRLLLLEGTPDAD